MTSSPLFIVGSGRSGTTLLRAMVDGHPEVAVTPESHFLPQLIRQLPGSVDSKQVELIRETLSGSSWFRDWRIDPHDVAAALGEVVPLPRPEALKLIYQHYANANGKPRWCDKTPAYVYQLPIIATEFSDSQFIHMVRDGRDVALSFIEAPFGPDTVEKAALNWRLRVRRGRRQGLALGEGRYLEIRYEDLIQSPIDVLERVCSFADLSFDSRMLDYQERAKRIVGTKPEGQQLYGSLKKTRSWEEQMSPSQISRFEFLAGHTLRDFGYNAGHPVTNRDRIAAATAWCRWTAHRVRVKCCG